MPHSRILLVGKLNVNKTGKPKTVIKSRYYKKRVQTLTKLVNSH
jgi:hypothetical protein